MLLAIRWWEAMAGSQHPQVTRTLRKLGGYHGRVEAFVAWGWRQLPPRTLIESVEHLHEEGLMGRLDATKIEESILAIVEQPGSWKPRTDQGEKKPLTQRVSP